MRRRGDCSRRGVESRRSIGRGAGIRSMSTAPGSRNTHLLSMPTLDLRVLVVAGPTHEPIDAVRYLANRSSGRMGEALADAALAAGATVTLLLGPTGRQVAPRWHNCPRFESSADLESALARLMPDHDCLFMAAAVADYRPAVPASGKLRRAGPLTLELVPNRDLLAGVAAARRPGQFLVGFALEPVADLERSAREKLDRKQIDAIVANELATMGSERIDGHLYLRSGERLDPPLAGGMAKGAFACWLMETLLPLAVRRREEAGAC